MLKFSYKYILILLLPIAAFSQNIEPEPFYFDNWDSTNYSTLGPLSKSYFKQDKIIKGFQWYGDYGLLNALSMNSKVNGTIDLEYEDPCDPDTTELSFDNPMYELRQAGVCHNMVGMQYEPTLQLTTDEFNNYKTRVGDNSNPVFGFENITGDILTDDTDPNYSRLVLHDSIASTSCLCLPCFTCTITYSRERKSCYKEDKE